MLRDVERKLLFLEGGSPRPTLSISHLISGDFSCTYHGYVLAQMAVAQARSYFLARDGHLVDNPRIGPELAKVWWQPGNSVRFADFVRNLTGEDAERRPARRPSESNRRAASGRSAASIARLGQIPPPPEPIDLDARIQSYTAHNQSPNTAGISLSSHCNSRTGSIARERLQKEAAQASVAERQRLAEVLRQARDFSGAARLLDGCGAAALVAELYVQGGRYVEAAEAYLRAGEVERAAAAFERGGAMERALEALPRAGRA